MGKDGYLSFLNYKNNAQQDSVLSTDENGKVIMKLGTDSIDVSKLSGDTINRKHFPTFVTTIAHMGAGERMVYGDSSSTLYTKNLHGTSDTNNSNRRKLY
jgi:hypothetical protein